MTKRIRAALFHLVSCSIFMLVASCTGIGFDCEKALKSKSVSPDGRFVAEVLLVQCGATTEDATWVQLTSTQEGGGVNQDPAAVFEGGEVDLSWDGDVLVVSRKGGGKIFKMEQISNGIKIVYRN